MIHLFETVKIANRISKILRVTAAEVAVLRKRFGIPIQVTPRGFLGEKLKAIPGGTEGMTLKEICAAVGSKSAGTIYSALKRNRLPFRMLKLRVHECNSVSRRRHIIDSATDTEVNWISTTESEENLWIAVINNAVKDLRSKNELHRSSARYWIASDSDHFPAFRAVCGELRLDYEQVRDRIFQNLIDDERFEAERQQKIEAMESA